MDPDDLIAELDDALAQSGETIILRRVVGPVPKQQNIDVECPASVRSWHLSEQELVGTTSRALINVIISPTPIKNAQWPGGAFRVTDNPLVDQSIPQRTDRCIVKGQLRSIEAVEPIAVNGVIVRIEMRMIG